MRLFLILILFGKQLLASELFTVGLQVKFEYSDLHSHCRLSALVEPYRLAAEIENGQVVRARLFKKGPHLSPTDYDFTKEELRGLEIREEAGLMWLKSLRASSEMLQILIQTGAGLGSHTCVPPQEIAREVLESSHFDFGITEVGYLLPHLINSNELVFHGRNNFVGPFRIKLSLVQDRR